MKKLFVILLCSMGLLQTALSQNTKYKFYTLKECKNDTLAFFWANYAENWADYSRHLINGIGQRYIDSPLRVLIDEAKKEGIVFRSIRFNVYSDYVEMYLNVLPKEQAEITMKDKGEYPHLCIRLTVGHYSREHCFVSRKQNVFYDLDDEFMDSIASMRVLELQPFFDSRELDEKYRRISAEIQGKL